jgi:DNA-directed RNA polymerase specialized sigma24 family protein
MSLRGPVLRRKAFLLTGDWSAADDLVQEVLVTVFTRWSRVARGTNIDAYANKVLAGKYVDSRRRPWRREHAVPTPPDRSDPAAQDAFDLIEDHDGHLPSPSRRCRQANARWSCCGSPTT